jgi:hypothetical protein
VTRELAWVGTVALLFGLGSSYATGALGAFGAVNLALAAAAPAAALPPAPGACARSAAATRAGSSRGLLRHRAALPRRGPRARGRAAPGCA